MHVKLLGVMDDEEVPPDLVIRMASITVTVSGGGGSSGSQSMEMEASVYGGVGGARILTNEYKTSHVRER